MIQEYKLQEVSTDDFNDGLVLGMRLFMASDHPGDEGRERLKNRISDFGFSVARMHFGHQTVTIHLHDQFVTVRELDKLANEGISL